MVYPKTNPVVVLFMTKPMTLFVALETKPLAELSVVPDAVKVKLPTPV